MSGERTLRAVAEFHRNAAEIQPNQRYFGWQVAYLVFGKSERWWSHNKRRLLLEGFPRPISNTFNAPWFGADLLAWMARPDKSVAADGGAVFDLTSVLRERARAIAGDRK